MSLAFDPPHIDLSVEIGAGSIYSTVDDLCLLKSALAKDGFLKRETRRRMLIPVTQDAQMGYGYGVMTGHQFGRACWGHSGSTFGFTSSLTYYPGEDLTVIVLANLDNGSAVKLEQDLAAAVLGEPYRLPRAVLANYEGTYRTEYGGRTSNARVRLDGDHLCVQFPLLSGAQLKALSQTRFQGRFKGGDVTFEFLTEGGRVTGIKLDWLGYKMFAPRVT